MDRFIDFGFGLIIFPFPSPNFGHFFVYFFHVLAAGFAKSSKKVQNGEENGERKKSTCSASLAHKPINTEFDF